MKPYKFFYLLFYFIILLLLVGCKSTFWYKPPYLPVKFGFNNNGEISYIAEISVVTFIGEFAIGAEHPITSGNVEDKVIVIFRNRNNPPEKQDKVYRIDSICKKLNSTLNGKTIIQIENNQVIIDITNNEILNLEFTCDQEINYWSDFWDKGKHPYRLFKVMYLYCKESNVHSVVLGIYLFFIELFAFPLFFIQRLIILIFGDVGWYGAIGLFIGFTLFSLFSIKSRIVLSMIMIPMFICFVIISLM